MFATIPQYIPYGNILDTKMIWKVSALLVNVKKVGNSQRKCNWEHWTSMDGYWCISWIFAFLVFQIGKINLIRLNIRIIPYITEKLDYVSQDNDICWSWKGIAYYSWTWCWRKYCGCSWRGYWCKTTWGYYHWSYLFHRWIQYRNIVPNQQYCIWGTDNFSYNIE